MKRLAVDDAAKRYWESYYEDLGYGEDLTRKVPRRIARVLEAHLQDSRKAEVLAGALVPHTAYREDRLGPGNRTGSGKSPVVVFEGAFGVVYAPTKTAGKQPAGDSKGRAFHVFRAYMQDGEVLRAEILG